MQQLGRLLLVLAGLLAGLGLLLLLLGHLGAGRLPGDIVIRGKHTTVYLPLATSLLLSLLATALLWLLRR